jgi:hypothetical protein
MLDGYTVTACTPNSATATERGTARLRGALQWHEGALETEGENVVGKPITRRLVLRDFRASPGMGVIAVLYQPYIMHIDHYGMRVRGLEEVQLDDGRVAAVLQEWLVSLTVNGFRLCHLVNTLTARRRSVQSGSAWSDSCQPARCRPGR